jgi:hypothetical protein
VVGVFRVREIVGLCAATALGAASLVPDRAFAAEDPVAPSSYQIERLGNQGIKLTSKNAENSYAITVLGSSAETTAITAPTADAWQKSLGVELEGQVGTYLKTDLRTRFTEVEGILDATTFAQPGMDFATKDRRALEELFFTSRFLGDRITVTSARRAVNRDGLDPALNGAAAYAKDQFNAWVWRSKRTSLSVEGMASRVDSGFQQNLQSAPQGRTEETQQLKSKLSFGRAGVFVTQRDSRALASDRTTVLSHESAIETGASLRLSDFRQGAPLFYLLPDSVWVSTTRGSVGQGSSSSSELRPMEKSAIGMTRNWQAASVNLSYWRSAVTDPSSVVEQAQWYGRGMDVGGTAKSGPLSVSGSLSWSTADNVMASNNTVQNNVNGSLYLTYSPATWPKLSAGVTNYAYQNALLDYGGLEENSLMRYELGVDTSSLLSAWSAPGAQLKFIASYQGKSAHSRWAESSSVNGTSDVFLGLKFLHALR